MVSTDPNTQTRARSRNDGRLRSRADNSARLALIVFAAVEAGMLVAVLVLASHQWFTYDEWGNLAGRQAGSLFGIKGLLRSQNGNWSTLPILAYKGWFHVVGLRSYLPYQMTNVLLHLTGGALLFTVMRRSGVRPWIATAAASLFVLFGSGYQNIIWGIQGFVASLVFGLTQLLLAGHDGPIRKRDWVGLLAGLAGLMSSAVAVPMIAVVGMATFVRRGWRAAIFHAVPLAVVYATWWIGYGQRYYQQYYHGSSVGGHLRLLARWVETGIRASFDAMGQLPGVGIVLAVLLLAGLVVAWRGLDRAEVRNRAAEPGALLIGAVIFLLVSGWERAYSNSSNLETEGGHYLYIAVAMSLPAIAVAADAIAGRWRLLMPAVLAPLVVGVPGNLQALGSPVGILDKNFQIAYRQSMLSLVSVPAAYAVPRSISPDAVIELLKPRPSSVTMGWLLDQKAAGRLPNLGANDLFVHEPHAAGPRTKAEVGHLLADATLRLSLQQSRTSSGSGATSALSGPSSGSVGQPGATVPASSSPAVLIAHSSKLGTILVDSKGMTLYIHTKGYYPMSCSATCVRTWPVLALPASYTTATGGPGVTGLGKAAIGRAVTYLGFPLFRYAGDKTPGETKGNGVATYGGQWHVVRPAMPRTCSALVSPVIHRVQKGDVIQISGGAVALTYFAGPSHSDIMTFNPANGNTLRAIDGPLTIRMERADPGQSVTVCM